MADSRSAKHEIIIIGAGIAGLAAARALSDAGRPALVVEARDRVGGRIHTIRHRAYPVPIELGAEFVHGRPEATWKLIREAGLVACDLPFEHWRRHAGRLAPTQDYSASLGRVMRGLGRLKKDVTFAEHLRSRRTGRHDAEAKRMAIDFVQGFDAADPERISAKSVAREQEGLGKVGEEMQFRLPGGYDSLAAHLVRSLNARRVRIRLNTPITEVRWERNRVELIAGRPGGNRQAALRASRLIITLPLGVLLLPPGAAGAVRFSPDLPEIRSAASHLASGPVIKAVLKFRRPFWETPETARAAGADRRLRDAAFLHAPEGAFITWWTTRPLRAAVLTGWAAGPSASVLSGRSSEALVDEAVRSLGGLFRRRPAAIASELEAWRVHDWLADPWSRGAYSYECIGGGRARRRLSEPVEGTLHFAGEATDVTGQASTVAGAIASGERAARQVLESL